MGSVKTGLVVGAIMLTAIVIIAVVAVAWMPKTTTAPDFTLTDIDGQVVTLSGFRGRVLLLDFMYIACPGCKIVTQNLRQLDPLFGDDLRILMVDILQYDTVDDLRSYRAAPFPPDLWQIPWQIARDTDSLMSRYGVGDLPHVVIVDRNGVVTWNWKATGVINPGAQKDEMQREMSEALAGFAAPTSVGQASIATLAIMAAIGSFFSPCSFPLLPGYMAYYLGVDAESGKKSSTLRAASRGALASFGMICVYGIIALVVFSVGYSAAMFLPLLGPIVGVILILLGALTLSNLQYHKIVEPFRRLRQRLFPSKKESSGEVVTGVKMFGYGVGYGAAGFACVAPPFIAAVLNATIYGSIFDGIFVITIYSVLVIALMVSITILLNEAGQAAISKLNRYVNVIKKVSGVALIIAGAYLVYFYYSTSHA